MIPRRLRIGGAAAVERPPDERLQDAGAEKDARIDDRRRDARMLGRLTSLAIVQDSVKPGISSPIRRNQESVAASGHATFATSGSHASA